MVRITIGANNVKIGLAAEANYASGPNAVNPAALPYAENCSNAATTWLSLDKVKSFTMPITKREFKFDELALSDNAFPSQVYAGEEKSVDGKLLQYLQSAFTSANNMLAWLCDATGVNGGNVNAYSMYWRIGANAGSNAVYNTFGTQPSDVKITWEIGKPTMVESTLMCASSRSSVDGIASPPIQSTVEPIFNSSNYNIWNNLTLATSGVNTGTLISLATIKAKKVILDVKAAYDTDNYDLSKGQVYMPIVTGYTGELTITYLEPGSFDSLGGQLQALTPQGANATLTMLVPTTTIVLAGITVKTLDDEGEWARKLKEYNVVFGFTGITLS